MESGDLEFTYEVRNEIVHIHHRGKPATMLRGDSARDFLARAELESASEMQQRMARITGNYKRGNERQARQHPCNR